MAGREDLHTKTKIKNNQEGKSMKYLVLGAGRMGWAVIYDLVKHSNADEIFVVDGDEERLKLTEKEFNDKRIKTHKVDIANSKTLAPFMSQCVVTIGCASYKYNYDLSKLAIECGCSYIDLGGNESIVAKQFSLHEEAKKKNVAIIPDCGLAPGLVSLLAYDGYQELDEVKEIKLRVGGLPVNPEPPLNYAIVFSPEGLINEYVEDCTIIKDGKVSTVPSLADTETIEFPQPFGKMEAFNTSGGISTLPKTIGAKVKNLDYKTIRYPGHCEQMRLLMDLGLMDSKPINVNQQQTIAPRTVLTQLLIDRLPKIEKDVVLIQVSVKGLLNGSTKEIVYETIDYFDDKTGLSAMMRTTAFPAAIIAQMIAQGQITERGVLTQELSIPTKVFLKQLNERGVKINRSDKVLAAQVK
jgi:lysine 6-dehydrogenase